MVSHDHGRLVAPVKSGDREFARVLRACAEAHPDARLRAAVALRFNSGWSYGEIGELFGVHKSSVFPWIDNFAAKEGLSVSRRQPAELSLLDTEENEKGTNDDE